MIDTVVLSIPSGKFQIMQHNRFSPSTIGLFQHPYLVMGARGFVKCVQNPSRIEMEKNGYMPRLTVIKAMRKGGFVVDLKIEYSIPKLLFGNNFDELDDGDFKLSVEKLYSKLYEMGVIVDVKDLKVAKVAAIHFAKNIVMKDFVSCSMILNELSKINLSSRIDIGTEKFRNGGHALHFKTNKRDLIFYDKLKDLEQAKISDNRAIENDNVVQLNLFDEINSRAKLGVLRMELRLGSKSEIEAALASINVECELTFSKLFSMSIAKKILNYYWSMIEAESYLLDFKSEGVFDIAETLKVSYPDMKSDKILKLVGAMVLSKEAGSRRLRDFLGYKGSPNANRQWYRLRKEVRQLTYEATASYKAIESVTSSLASFESLGFTEGLSLDSS